MALRPEVYSRDEHPISRNSIDPDALKILYRLMRHGHKAYLVGGGVRDLLLNRKPKDFDIATDATPRQIKELFRNSRIIGRRFKLIHVFFRGNKIVEVSTFRDVSEEVAEPQEGESPEELIITRDNTYGTEVTDAMRRDITINGLFYDAGTFSIIDYVGGMRDIRDRVVRIIGDPDVRFPEDPVRLMRICRYAAKSGFNIDAACYASIQRNAELIRNSATMRVFEEFKKDFASGFALQTLRLLAETGLLAHLIPELAENDAALLNEESDFAKTLAHSDEMVLDGEPRSPTVVLALISLFTRCPILDGLPEQFRDREDIAEHVASGFRALAVPRKEREKIEALLQAWHMLLTSGDDRSQIRQLDRREVLDEFELLIHLLYGKGPESDLLADLLEQGSERGRPDSGYHEEESRGFHQNRGPRRRRGGRGRGGQRHRPPQQ
ncbi:MAG: polynucleotide adenylyltransferase PcnB [Deltaproteobacteria bacterium]|nr:polynucleotide adenylyltransferase PcnB [Deltaproteobacteria bacterium]